MLTHKYVVKPNKSLENDSIKALVTSFFGEDHDLVQLFMRGLNSEQNICTFEAFVEDELVGIITAWRTNFHPYCTYFSMAVRPFYRHNVEQILLKHLENHEGLVYPLQTAVWETNYRLRAFFEAGGFKEIRRTYNSWVKTSSIPVDDELLENMNIGDKSMVCCVKDIYHLIDLKRQLIMLVRDTYQKTHTANPLGIFDDNVWEDMIFTEDLIQEASYLILHDQEIHAFALLHDSAVPNRLEFGWRGVKKERDMSLISLLTAYQMGYGHDQGYEYIDGEIDTTDPYSLEMLAAFPFSPAPSWITYQKGAR